SREPQLGADAGARGVERRLRAGAIGAEREPRARAGRPAAGAVVVRAGVEVEQAPLDARLRADRPKAAAPRRVQATGDAERVLQHVPVVATAVLRGVVPAVVGADAGHHHVAQLPTGALHRAGLAALAVGGDVDLAERLDDAER